MYVKQTIQIGGRSLSLETGKIARQADGAVMVTCGETVVLVTAVAAKEPSARGFFPLTVDYREYGYASGRIPGGYFKREGRPTEREILTCRLIDRPLRPLFTDGFDCETQIIALVMSADKHNDPDVLAITGASAALYISDIPFETPIAGVRVGLVDGKLVINPTYQEVRASSLNLTVAGSEEAIVMVEASAKEVSEEIIIEALLFGHNEIKRLCAFQHDLRAKVGKPKRKVTPVVLDEAILQAVAAEYTERLRAALDVRGRSKLTSYAELDALEKEVVERYPADNPDQRAMAKRVFEHLKEKIFREDILLNRRRPDGRKFSEIRPIEIEVGVLPRAHGSALFTRGETQAIVTATLGTSQDVQYLDDLEVGEIKRDFMLNYNFLPFSVGEIGRMGSPGRREVGHGALAHRALQAVLPTDDFPYVTRVVSDITESNGSSSMATVCGGALALMDAGVPIKAPVAGVAMGLVMDDKRYAVLTDIAGAEDHYGDMDFKVAGTRHGVTALQMDIKVKGLNAQILADALQQAKQGRLYILDKMQAVLPAPRPQINPLAPRILTFQIPVAKIRDVIGTGGKVIRGIVEKTGCKIDIEDSGRVIIAASDQEAGRRAQAMIEAITEEAEPGKTYLGTVTRIAEFGAFVEIFPGTEGLLHISEIANYRVRSVADELKEGQQLMVKCLSTDPSGKIRLSRRALLEEEASTQGSSERPAGPERDNDRRPRRR
ncbi:MAG: polyribonucleotide nucleotidyltransferase [Chloracidobacterium sp.]|nr:polyribonucleotide nucleotidyltransferase [Chloracidobacterium sp.]MDW8218762.1 polyribonucleotide nucleotidyltransferase [Acidobacteriota bacterium]